MARWREVLLEIDGELQRLAPADARVLQTLDPATLLLTACIERLPEGYDLPSWVPARTMELDFDGRDPYSIAELASSRRPAGALSEAPEGAESARRSEVLVPLGIADDLRVVFREGETTWGAALLYRFDRCFEPAEVEAVAALSREFGRRVRLGILEDAVRQSGGSAAPPGVARLAERDFAEASPAAAAWLATLADEQRVAAATTLASPGARSVTIVGSSGPVAIHAEDDGARTVIVERAGPSATGEMLMAAYDLTPRERDIVGLVAHGMSATQMARRLEISEWTVKDHAKAVNRKIGVGSRNELLAALFARHFAPHLGAGALPGPRGHFLTAPESRPARR